LKEPAVAAIELTPEDLNTVYDALCLAGVPCAAEWLLQFLHLLPREHSQRRPFILFSSVDPSQRLANLEWARVS